MKIITNIFLITLTISLAIACLARMDNAPISLFRATEKTAIGEKLFDLETGSIARIQIRHSGGNFLDIEGSGEQWHALHPWKDRVDYHTHVEPLLHFIHNSKVLDAIPRWDLNIGDVGMSKDFYEIEIFDHEANSLETFKLGCRTPWHAIGEDEDKTKLPTFFLRHKSKSKKAYIYLVSDTSLQLETLFDVEFKKFRDHRPFSVYQTISQIRLMRKGTDILMERTALDQPWFLTKPLELRCDQAKVKELVGDLSVLSAIDVDDATPFPETLNPDESLEIGIKHFGEENEVTLTIALPSDTSSEVALAKISNREPTFSLPINPNSEVEISLSKLPESLNDLRAKTMLSLNGKELQTIVIKSRNTPAILLNRERSKPYQLIQADGQQDIEVETFANFIKALTLDPVVNFVSDAAVDLKQYGLDQPDLDIALVDFAKNQKRLHISRDEKSSSIYAHIAHSPIIWQISEETLSMLDRPTWDWRPKKLWNLPDIDITSISSRYANKPETIVSYNFDNDSYSATSEGKDLTDQLNPNRARYFFESISQLESFRRLGPYNEKAKELLKAPDFTLTVTVQEYDDEGEPSYDIDHWLKLARASKSAGNQFYYVSISGESDYFLFDSSGANILATDIFEN